MFDPSVIDFLARLKKSGAIESKKYRKWLSEHGMSDPVDPKDCPFSSLKQVSRSLLKAGLLTRWQIKFLLSGRHQLKFGNYVLLERIARDEDGNRFLAKHASLDRHVELFLFKPPLSDDERRREALIAKAAQVGKLDHPGLVHVYDVDRMDDQYYLAVEHVSGQRVDSESAAGMSLSAIGRLVRDGIQALDYAHEHGVIHGAIRPDDVILADSGSTKISNLALASLLRTNERERLQPMDDYLALSAIGLRLLKLNQPTTIPPRFESLQRLLTRMRKEGKGILPELDQWLEDSPSFIGGEDSDIVPAALVPEANESETKANEGSFDDEADVGGFVQSYWHDNPVRVIALAVTITLLAGLAVAGLFYDQTGGGDSPKTAENGRRWVRGRRAIATNQF